MKIHGRVHRFGDNINTDYIIAAQHKASSLDIDQIAKHTFADIDPDFITRVRPGDLIVAGRNFGCGSSRETAVRVLRSLGIAAVLAQSFARIYYRNAINAGLPVLECDTSGIQPNDDIEVRLEEHIALNHTQTTRIAVTPLPEVMQAVLATGGMGPYLRRHGDLVLPSPDQHPGVSGGSL